MEQSREYDSFDWNTLYNTGEIRKLKVCDLDKYLHKHNLSSENKMLKKDKVKIVEAHIGQKLCQTTLEGFHRQDNTNEVVEDEEKEDNDPEHAVIGVLGETEESGSESDSDIENELFLVSRSGRQCTTWKSRNYVD